MCIEEAKIKKCPRFGLEDLIKIINEVAKKEKIPERDLQDKIITKETMVRFINHDINKAFGFAVGDQVIQIGTVFWRYGEKEICHNNIITLKGCDKFDIGDKPCEVISKSMERDVLLEWTKLIEEHDPDIVIGYNTFGFDESFMYDRITDLCMDTDKMTLNREDLKTLSSNMQYQKFINLGRLDDSILKKVPDAKGCMVNKKLSSSALGDNFLYYFNMPGRVQIDLLKVCQSSLTKLPSYKLDSVAEYYISGKIKEIICDGDGGDGGDSGCVLKVDNIQELQLGNFIVISMATTTAKLFDGEKLKILEINHDKKQIKVDRMVPKTCLPSGPVWGMGKDDITPQDIFRMQKGTNAERAEIAKYCIQDCALLIRLLRKLDVVTNNFGMSNVCMVPFSYIFLRGQGIKTFSLVTNECGKENFLLPVLEKIEPEEVEVADNVRRVHTQIAGQTENLDEGEADIGNDDGIDLSAVVDEEIGDDDGDGGGGDANDGKDTDFVEDESETETETEIESVSRKEKKVVKFSLKSNFNQIIMTDDTYEGAIVLEPKCDIYTEDPITVMDFSSLYPSEMITSDLSHDRICEDPYWLGETGAKRLIDLGYTYLDRSYDSYEWIDPHKRSKGKRKTGVVTVRFVQYPDGQKGLIPKILMELLKNRKLTKKKMETEPDQFKKSVYDGLQLAYKVTANSIYGQIGARTSKIYKPQIASSTTAGGRNRLIHARDFTLKHYKSTVVAGDTDSIMILFDLRDENGIKPIGRDLIEKAIAIGLELEERIRVELPGIHCLSYEKVLFPAMFIAKKKYTAIKYENSPDTCKQISMGLITKRRDNAPILKHIFIGVLDMIMKERNVPKSIRFVQDEIRKMIDGKFELNMYIISKSLASYYKDEESIAHKVLANRMTDRDPGSAPKSNDRLGYVFIKIKEEPGIDYLNGDRIEHIDYVRKHNLKVDFEKYILNQVMKPVSQIYELIVETLNGFPYGIGYYEEMYNIWYNKYNGDAEKAKNKIKKLKAIMVKKLIFDPLIQYANEKVNNIQTLDNWFTEIGEVDEVDEIGEVDEVDEVVKVDKVEEKQKQKEIKSKPKHTMKIKKNKQLNLDAFLNL